MQGICLFVDIDQKGLSQDWQAPIAAKVFPMKIRTAVGAEAALKIIKTESLQALVLFGSGEHHIDMEETLAAFHKKNGIFPDFQMIICDDPKPTFMAQMFEFGVDKFANLQDWIDEVTIFLTQTNQVLNDEEAPYQKCVKLNRVVQDAVQSKIASLEKSLTIESTYSIQAAHSRAKALEAGGNYEEALAALENTSKLNSIYIPTKSSIGDNLFLNGQTDQAIQVFEDLEKRNKYSYDRKLQLANAYSERGELVVANRYIEEAIALNPKSKRTLEAKVYWLLASQKISEALGLMDQLEDVGPKLVSKINSLAVTMSQQGKGKSALLLYNKAHKIIKKSLKYKVSLNAALACHRIKEYDEALKYLDRSEKEYGGRYPKLIKIRAIVTDAMEKAKKVTNNPSKAKPAK